MDLNECLARVHLTWYWHRWTIGQYAGITAPGHYLRDYRIKCSNARHAQASVTVVVAAPAYRGVSGSIGVTPDTIRRGESILLQWNSFNATHVVITPDIGEVPLQGQLHVSPRETTTYTIIIENASSRNTGTLLST